MNFRIEYHEERGHFHLDTGNNPPNTYGWKTIAESEEDRKASNFCAIVEELYLSGKAKPSIKEIKKLWDFYNMVFSKIK